MFEMLKKEEGGGEYFAVLDNLTRQLIFYTYYLYCGGSYTQ